MSGDEESDRPRRSWSEIDKLRDRPHARRDAPGPRSPAAEARSRMASKQYLGRMDRQVFGKAEVESAREVHEAHGTSELSTVCRRYLVEHGSPDASLASLFLDADATDVQRAGLEALARQREAGALSLSPGMRTQLRLLAQSSDDDVAYAAEELLAAL